MWCLTLFLLLYLAVRSAEKLSYIVEIENPTAFLTEHPEAHVRQTFNSTILRGVSVSFDSAEHANRAIRDPLVIQSWPITRYSRPMSSNFIRQVPEATRNLTVQNLAYQQLKHNGNGIRIGIIDSGVDYLHPALGGCFGPNCKARYGYNLVGDDYTGDIATLKPDDDPMDSCGAGSEGTGHGTHVSGIIAADDEQLNWTGVAPGPIIGMWRVFSCHKIVAPNDILIKTMEMAYEAKLDIINLSRGENGGWAEDPLSIIADRIVDAGVYVVVASGDAGANGIFLTAAPASDRKVIATGSVDNLHVKGLPDGLIGTGGLGGK